MRRTPIFDDKNRILNTAFDQLNPTPHPAIAAGLGGSPKDVATSLGSVWQFDQMLKLFRDDLGFELSDLFGLQYYMLRFLTSCSDRREMETEPINLLQYVGGADSSRRLSKTTIDFLKHAPRALAAMSATESDARTQLNITAQLVGVNSLGQSSDSMTLNGPTSKVWLDHWKTYLKGQGVGFFVGNIASLAKANGRFMPCWQSDDTCRSVVGPIPEDPELRFKAPSKNGEDIEQFRFVLALSYQKVTDLLWEHADDVMSASGPFRQIVEFDVNGGRRKFGNPGLIPIDRDPLTGAEPLGYPLRTISGAQMFFPGNYRFGEGNVYFARTAWDLTSISQLSYWKNPDSLGEFRGQISVDIGAWHEFAGRPGIRASTVDHGNVAWNSSANEIAAEVWAQVKSGFETAYGDVVQAPRCFHLDRNLVFSEVENLKKCRHAVIRIVSRDADLVGKIKDLLDIDVHTAVGSNVTPPMSLSKRDASGLRLLNDRFAAAINDAWPLVNAVGLSSSDDPKEPQDVLIGPWAFGQRFIVEFSAVSNNRFFLSCARLNAEKEVRRFEIKERAARVAALIENLPTDPEIKVTPLDNEQRAFLLEAAEDVQLWIANADGAVEIADGPTFHIALMGDALRFFGGEIGGSDTIASGAVRANALVTVGSWEKKVIHPFKRLVDYGLGVGIGVGQPIHTNSAKGVSPEEVRDHLFDWLTSAAKNFVIAERVNNGTGFGIVMSPVTAQSSALVRVYPTWRENDAPNFSDDAARKDAFTISIDAKRVEVLGANLTVTQIRNAIMEELKAADLDAIELDAVGEDSLRITRVMSGSAFRPPLCVAVLNIDARIEVIGAPALIVETRNLLLKAPPQGFVVMRNDAEFLINIFDQWRLRPGLQRERSEIPKRYRQLAADFGNNDTEIYYGSSKECRLFEHWTPAGTYMATYTRLTTMEAANESGRHAAAAILYQLLASGRRDPSGQPIGLVGNLPFIWRVEDHEPDDLRFAKQLDNGLVAANLPHALDIIGVTELVNLILASSVNDKPLLTEAIALIRAALGQPHQATLANLKTLADRLMVLTRFKSFGG